MGPINPWHDLTTEQVKKIVELKQTVELMYQRHSEIRDIMKRYIEKTCLSFDLQRETTKLDKSEMHFSMEWEDGEICILDSMGDKQTFNTMYNGELEDFRDNLYEMLNDLKMRELIKQETFFVFIYGDKPEDWEIWEMPKKYEAKIATLIDKSEGKYCIEIYEFLKEHGSKNSANKYWIRKDDG